MQDASGNRGLVVDLGVYTRNRSFRLYLSSKAGKDATLLPTGTDPLCYSQLQQKLESIGDVHYLG